MDLEKILKSKTNLKIIKFFDQHPQCIDTAEGVSTWTGISLKTTNAALKKLIRHKIILEYKSLSTTAYAYTHDKKIATKVHNWFKSHPAKINF